MVYQTNNVYFICSFAAIGEFFGFAPSMHFDGNTERDV
jgi:hypothetical protein